MAGIEYHWLVTLQWNVGGVLAAGTREGTITAGEGATRQDLTLDVLKYAREQLSLTTDTVTVLCFVLEENILEPKQPKKGKAKRP